MEMPYNLQALPPEAIDILRYFATLDADSAHADEIVDGAGLSDRGFGKGIRRLVTKNYLIMSGDQVYRLTDQGRRVVEEVKSYGSDLTGTPASGGDARFLRRHLVVVAPNALTAGKPTEIALGFAEADEDEYLTEPANLLMRLAVVNGEPHRPLETQLKLTNRHMQQSFQITAGNYTTVRLRVEVCQYREDGDDYDFCGGMYVDLPVTTDAASAATTAYGSEVILKEE